jgi:heme-degrading monooxygenase HmoA
MIIETAQIRIADGREGDFEQALEAAKAVIARAPGFREIHVHRGVERPDTFLLAIGWDTLADHTEGFRGSPLFDQWRGIISEFFAEPPQVEHWQLLA